MFSQGDFIVGVWFIPVILCILVPLAMLLVYGIVRTAKKAAEKGRALELERREKSEEACADSYQPTAAA